MRSEIQSSASVGYLCVELASRFGDYYRAPRLEGRSGTPKLIRAICLYAVWCTRSASVETQQAAGIEFYGGIPRAALQCTAVVYKRIVNDLVAILGIAEIERSVGNSEFLADAREAELVRLRRSRKR